MPRYVMAIDASKCLNCKACLIACQQRNAVMLKALVTPKNLELF